MCVIKLEYHDHSGKIRNTFENLYKIYKIFNTSIDFPEIANVFK